MGFNVKKLFGVVPLLFVPYLIVFIVLVWRRRKTRPIQKRYYPFVLLYQIGNMLAIMLLSGNLLYTPRNCDFWMVAIGLEIPLVLVPYLSVFLVYTLRCHLAKLHSLQQPNTRVVNILSFFFHEHIWATLILSFFITMIPFMIIPWVIYKNEDHLDVDFTGQKVPYHYGLGDATCVYGIGRLFLPYWLSAVVVYASGTFFVMFYLLKMMDDAYHIKEQMKYTFCVHILTSPLYLLLLIPINGVEIGDILPFEFLSIIFIYLTTIPNDVWMYYMAKHDENIRVTYDLSSLPDQLRNNSNFRDDFLQFLKLQFCVENLLFWENVERFQQFETIEQQEREAVFIFDRYIKEKAPYQVNLKSNVVDEINQKIKNNNIDTNIFNAAQNEILGLMMYDSYRVFCSRRPSIQEIRIL